MKYFIKTYGCQMNESDSEHIANFLKNKKYKSAPKMEGADLVVVNACSVRQTAIDRIFGLKQKFKKLKTPAYVKASAGKKKIPKFILTGCVLNSDKKKFKEFFDEILSIDEFYKTSNNSPLIPIMTGCNNFCSYCVVPYTRGREKSKKPEEIIKQVKALKNKKEIILLGQNVNSYLPAGKAGEYGFVNLLKDLNKIPGNFTIKFLTNHPKDFSDELINTIAKSKKVAKEIHLPIQSGDDEILKKMNRGYTIKQYKNLVKKIQKKIPDIKISTDVIVGFPNETKKQFENTVNLFKQIKFDKAYINKYSLRSGTAAANLKDNVLWQEKKRRWKILNDMINPPAQRSRLVVILGPTASGKSKMAIKLAKEFSAPKGRDLAKGGNGFEIVSADSKQVYKEMNIGTGKITPDTKNSSNFNTGQVKNKYIFTHKGIPHYMLDIASPKKQITVAQYKEKALETIDKIYKKGKIPILCGGTGFYIQAVVEGTTIPEVKPDQKLRKELEKKTTNKLFEQLKKLDPRRAKEIDSKNRRRLVRALEIVLKTKKPVPYLKKDPQFRVSYIGIKKTLPELKKAINKRVDKMIKAGLEKEVKKLIKKYGWTQVLKNTIGYAEFSPYAKASGDKERIINLIKVHSLQFAKRQMTWFKRNKQINWVENYQQAKKFLNT